jgi:hypothetical protein
MQLQKKIGPLSSTRISLFNIFARAGNQLADGPFLGTLHAPGLLKNSHQTIKRMMRLTLEIATM